MGDSPVPDTGRLSVVATPIGNLEDITLRALRVLRGCDGVLAEDTRRTRALLRAHSIERPVERLDDHVMRARAGAVVERLRAGQWLALVSDAGTPMVSDPGSVLVQAAVAGGVLVEAIPGPSAVLVALVLAGVDPGGFRFVGFLPRGGISRREALAGIARDVLPTVLYESPERVGATLSELATVCAHDRRASVSRELTKRHEETLRGTLTELAERTVAGLRGEVTVVVEGATVSVQTDATSALDAALDAAMAAGMKPSDAARDVARALGLTRSEVYARALARGGRSP